MRELPIQRYDGLGQPISLRQSPAKGPVVVFAGDPGMGTSSELAHAGSHSRQRGDMVYQISASSADHETLAERFARALGEDWDRLRQEYPRRGLRPVKDVARSLAPQAFGRLRQTQLRSPSLGGFAPQATVTVADPRGIHQWRMSDLTDRLTALNKDEPRNFTLLIDNLDAATQKDLVDLNDLADHLARQGNDRRVQVVAAGSDRTLDRLMDASKGPGGIPSRIPQTYDTRRCLPLNATQMNEAIRLTSTERNTVVDPKSREILIDAANGNLGLMSQVHDRAQERAATRHPQPAPSPQRRRWFRRQQQPQQQQPVHIDASDMFHALQAVQYQNEFTFKHQLAGRENERDRHDDVRNQLDLLKAVAWHGREGMPAAGKENIDSARSKLVNAGALDEKALGSIDESRHRLVSAGVLRDDQGVLTFTNPLMLDHFRAQENLGPNVTVVSSEQEAYVNRQSDRERIEHFGRAQPDTAERTRPDPMQTQPHQTQPNAAWTQPHQSRTQADPAADWNTPNAAAPPEATSELRAGSAQRGMTPTEAGVLREVVDAGQTGLGGGELHQVRSRIGSDRFDYAADSLINDGWLGVQDGRLGLASAMPQQPDPQQPDPQQPTQQPSEGRHRRAAPPSRGDAQRGDLTPNERQLLRSVLDSTERGRPLTGTQHQDLVASMGRSEYQRARVGLIDRELAAPVGADAGQRAALLGMQRGTSPHATRIDPQPGQPSQGGRHRAANQRPSGPGTGR